MLTTLAVENQISQTMGRIGLSALVVGQLASLYGMTGLSQPRISQALSGAKPFENSKGQQLLSLVKDVAEMCDTIRADRGLPVLLNDSNQIKTMLDERRAARKALEEINATV